MNFNRIINHDFVEYLIQKESNPETQKENNAYRTVSYYKGSVGKIDFSFAKPTDHILFNGNQEFKLPTEHLIINSSNLNHTQIIADKPFSETILHIIMNHKFIDSAGKSHTGFNSFIRDVKAFLPNLITNDGQQLFKSIIFENMSADLGKIIGSECKKHNIDFKIEGNFYKCPVKKVKNINFDPTVGLKHITRLRDNTNTYL